MSGLWAAILPPQPNPGPLAAPAPLWDLPGLAAAAVTVGLVALAAWRTLRPRVATRSPSASSRAETPAAADPLSLWTDRIRSILASQLSPSILTLTPQEIAGSPEVTGRLGPELTGRVVDFLQASDAARFGRGVVDEQHWADQGADLVAALQSLPMGGNATISPVAVTESSEGMRP